MTQEQAAVAFGLSKGGYIKIEDGDRGLKADRIAKAAEVFKVQPADIIGELGDISAVASPAFEDALLERARAATAESGVELLPVVGEVAAGRWLEIDEFVDESAFDPVPVRPDPRWPAEHQYGLAVRGESINRFARDGDVLVCVSAVPARYRPKDGDLVIVELRRNAGLLRQRTAKRYLRTETHVELWPDSDHERWQKPIIIPKGLTPLEFFLEEEGGGIEAEIVAFVTSAVRQVQRWQPPSSISAARG